LRRLSENETIAMTVAKIQRMSGKIVGARRAQRQEASLLEHEPFDRSRRPGAVTR
jgi:hypothetical protein